MHYGVVVADIKARLLCFVAPLSLSPRRTKPFALVKKGSELLRRGLASRMHTVVAPGIPSQYTNHPADDDFLR
jgi:hypothetical protein